MTPDLTKTKGPVPTISDGAENIASEAPPSSATLEENGATRAPAAVLKTGKPPRATAVGPRAQDSKTELVLKKLRLARGATIAQIVETTGWQAHSVRGFMSAVVRKKLGLNLVSEVGKDGQRRYRITERISETD